MSSDHKPTYSLMEDDAARAFNPTEVRLYGLLGAHMPTLPQRIDFETPSQRVNIKVTPKRGPAPAAAVPTPKGSIVSISTKRDQFLMLLSVAFGQPDPMEAGVIFGYAYEGHAYDLPKPKIMLIPAKGKLLEEADHDTAYSGKPGYHVWVVDKLETCVEIDVNQGYIEQLVLEANLPGRRSPLTYRATSIASTHRSGRLSE